MSGISVSFLLTAHNVCRGSLRHGRPQAHQTDGQGVAANRHRGVRGDAVGGICGVEGHSARSVRGGRARDRRTRSSTADTAAGVIRVHRADAARCAQFGVFSEARRVSLTGHGILCGGERRPLRAMPRSVARGDTSGAHPVPGKLWVRLRRSRPPALPAGGERHPESIPLLVLHQLFGARSFRAQVHAAPTMDGRVRGAAGGQGGWRRRGAGVSAAAGDHRIGTTHRGLRLRAHSRRRAHSPQRRRVPSGGRQVHRGGERRVRPQRSADQAGLEVDTLMSKY
eukprot:ctg_3780.g603